MEATKQYKTPRAFARSPRRQSKFLEYLTAGHSVDASARGAGVNRRTVYDYRQRNPEFAAKWEDADAAGLGVLEDKLFERAVTGWKKPVFARGEQVGEIEEYDANLFILLLRSRSEKYGDKRTLALQGSQANPLHLVASKLDSLTAAQRLEMAGYLAAVVRGEETPSIRPELLQALTDSLGGALLGAQLKAMPEADLERLAGTHPGEGIHDDGVDHAG